MEPTKHKIKLNDRDGTIGTEFIYARIIGIMASSRDSIAISKLLTHELAHNQWHFLTMWSDEENKQGSAEKQATNPHGKKECMSSTSCHS